MIKIGDYAKIMSNRSTFNQAVYTPMSEALHLLDERSKDKELVARVEKLLGGNVPKFFKKGKYAVLGRHIATPNHESRMFINIAKENGLKPVFFEYHDDKFTPENKFKHSLGQLHIPQNTKGGLENIERLSIVDFNKHSGKKLREVETTWGEPLIGFHKKLFSVYNFSDEDFNSYDGSDWYKKVGGNINDFYFNFFLLFICHGILFENFLTSNDDEGDFTQDVVLPSIEKVLNLVGVKPLIIPLGPIEIETDGLWYHHLKKVKSLIPKK